MSLEGTRSSVRALRLTGLDTVACEQLLEEKEVVGTPEERVRLVEAYAGNPLALKVVAETIADLFAGEIGPFLKQGTAIFGSIQELLAEQISRLSAVEQTVLRWLAIGREPLSLEELLGLLVAPKPQGQVLAAVDSLRRRSLIERGKLPGSLTLHAVVLEYVTGLLIEEATSELVQGRLTRLIEHGLCQAGASKSGSSWLRSWHACAVCTRGEPKWRSTCSPCSPCCANGPSTLRAMDRRTW